VGAHVFENRVSEISDGHDFSLPPGRSLRNGKGLEFKSCAALEPELGDYHVNAKESGLFWCAGNLCLLLNAENPF
jgi:hypothetical protein